MKHFVLYYLKESAYDRYEKCSKSFLIFFKISEEDLTGKPEATNAKQYHN